MVIGQKFLDHIIQIEIGVKRGKLYMPVQSEVEYIATQVLGTHKNIFFDPIPFKNSLHLMWNEEIKGWEFCYKEEGGKNV